jgi:hypothetical protein
MMAQTFTLEFLVDGALDGATEVDYDIEGVFFDEDQIYVFSVPGNLGILNIGFFGDRTIGNRFIPWLWVFSSAAGVVGASVDVVDAREGLPPAVLDNVASLAGVTSRYVTPAAFVPQGAKLRFNGMTAIIGNPIKIRFNVIVPEWLQDAALIQTINECGLI